MRIAVVCLLIVMTHGVAAAGILQGPILSARIGSDSNPTMSPDDEQPTLFVTSAVKVPIRWASARTRVDIDAELQATAYSNSALQDPTANRLAAYVDRSFRRGRLTASHSRSVENATLLDPAETGRFDDAVDRESTDQTLAYSHILGPRWLVSLSYTRLANEFDGEPAGNFVDFEYDGAQATAQFTSGPRTQFSASVGQFRLRFPQSPNKTDTESVYLGVERQLTNRLNVSATLGTSQNVSSNTFFLFGVPFETTERTRVRLADIRLSRASEHGSFDAYARVSQSPNANGDLQREREFGLSVRRQLDERRDLVIDASNREFDVPASTATLPSRGFDTLTATLTTRARENTSVIAQLRYRRNVTERSNEFRPKAEAEGVSLFVGVSVRLSG